MRQDGVQHSRISLPPLVEGPVRGALRLSLGAVHWSEAAPAHLQQHTDDLGARLAWWGDASGGDLVPLPPPAGGGDRAPACLSFQLRTGPRYLTRYLKDMGALTITIEAAPSSASSGLGPAAAGAEGPAVVGADEAPRPLAAATVGLLALDVEAPICGSYPLVLAAGPGSPAAAMGSGSGGAGSSGGCNSSTPAIVGSLEVRLELDYSSSSGAAALVSSFELNERLATSAAEEANGVEEAAASTADGASDDGSSCSEAVAAAAPPSLCGQLVGALQDSELLAAALQQLGGSEGGEQPLQGPRMLQSCDVLSLLPLLLPSATRQQLESVAAMLQPFADAQNCSSPDGTAPAICLEQLAVAAAECAAVERRLAQQPAGEALQGLRQAAAALSSRSLDLAAAFAAEGQQLALAQLGALLQRLYPAATEDEARCLLALLAADGSGSSAVTLPALKAALGRVQEAQQFPTADDLARQQAATEARRAKEATAAATAAIEQQRAAAAAVAKVPPAQRKQAVVSKLKSSLQQRRRGSTSGSSVHSEAPVEPPAAHPAEVQQQVPQLPAVVLGIPVLPPPPPPAQLMAGLSAQLAPAQPSAVAALPPAAAAEVAGHPPAAAAAAADSVGQHHQPERQPEVEQPQQAERQVAAQPPPQQDALLQLIQQAEQLKTAMQQSSSGSGMAAASPPRSQLWEAAAASAAAPRLPNLLLPQAAPTSRTATLAEAAADGSLSAATAALLAAARALRLEAQQLPAVAPPAAAAAAAAAAAPGAAAPAPAPMAPAAAPPAGPAAGLRLAATAAAAADVSDAESDAEDALLDQLFFQRTQQPPPAAPGASASADAAAGAAAEPAAEPAAPVRQLVLRVQLGAPQLAGEAGSGGGGSSVRCVVKPLCAGGAVQQLTLPVAGAAGEGHAVVEVPLPAAALSDGQLPLLPPYLFLEFWRHSGSLVGVARVPLLQPPAGGGAAQERFPAAVVAEGRHAIAAILEERDAGAIHVAAVLQERGAPPLTAAVRHCFSVSIRSAHRLPSAAAYAGAGLRAPDARLLRYSFPGEPEALQTREVPCCSSPSFDATATHEMVLPAWRSLLPLLQEGLLRFELLDCWADQQQRQQHGWALLQLRELAGLAAEAEGCSASDGGAREASRVLLLPLCTEYESAAEAAGAAGSAGAVRGPSLKIELRYCAQLCTLDAAEVAAAAATAAPTAQQPARRSPAKQARAAPPKAAAGAGGSSSEDEDGENSLHLANRISSTSSGRQAQAVVPARGAAGGLGAAQSPARSIPAQPFMPATLSVEIIQASGLGAAVRAAAVAAGGGAGSSLGRAAVVGPHAFVRLALFPEADAALQAEAPPLQTAFVPQSFCPTWRSVHAYPLQLTAGMVQALASQSLRVEVWHRCPRATAGGSGSREAREVLLGAGTAPLLAVLRNPQGLRCWVPLTAGSSGTGVVGAAQVAARLTSLGSLSGSSAGGEPLLLRCMEAAALVPAPLRSRLLVPHGAGFDGQPAVVAVHLDTLVPPSSSSSLSGGRPKADRFFCRYSLPGSGTGSIATASRVLTCLGGSGAAALARRAGGRGPAAGGAAMEQQQWAAVLNHQGFFEVAANPELVAALLHTPLLVHVYKQPAGAATEGGRSAVLVGSAEIDLSPLLWSDSGSGSGSSAGEHGQEQRSIGGTYPLLEGAAAPQGGASLAARVQLQLRPDAGAAQQAAAASAAGADTAVEERPQPAVQQQQAVEHGVPASPPLQHPLHEQQQLRALAGSPFSSSDDDDEAQEELLRRCQRLRAALRTLPPGQAAEAGAAAASGSGCGATVCASGAAALGEEPAAGAGNGQQAAAAQVAAAAPAAGGSSAAAPRQQQQLSSAVAASSSSPALRLTQLERPPAPEEAEEGGQLLLQIDSALHLPAELPGGSSSEGYSAFVAATWGPHQLQTAAVPVHVVAAAELGGTAVWHAELELPAAAAAWEAPPSSSSGVGGGPTLLLKVWATPSSSHCSSGSSGSVQLASAADTLLGCCLLDLRLLPSMQQVAGWWHIVDAQQRQQGQLKAAVRPNATLREALHQQRGQQGQAQEAAVGGPAASPLPLQGQQQLGGQQVQPAAEPAADQAEAQRQQAGGDLAQQVQAQLQELQLLSERLAAGPQVVAAGPTAPPSDAQPGRSHAASAPAAEALPSPAAGAAFAESGQPSAAATAGGGAHQPSPAPAAAAADDDADDAAVRALLAAAGPLQADADMLKPFDALPASDDEWDGSALPLDPRQESLYAWSGSDSDDGMGLVGIAVDGAISGEVTEEEQEEERPRAPARLLSEDWMFAISKPAQSEQEEPWEAAAAAGQQQGEQGEPPSRRRPQVVFRNVIPGGALGGAAGREPTASASHLDELAEQRRNEEAQEEAAGPELRHPGSVETAAAAAAAGSAASAAAAARLAAAQGPTLDQFGAMPPAPAAPSAPVQLHQPLPHRQQLGGMLQPGWQFDIRKEVPPAAFAAAGGGDQFAAQQQQPSAAAAAAATPAPAATPAGLLAQQRAELQQHSQAGRSPAAATIDEVLAQLRGRGRGAAGSGAPGAGGA